MNNIYLNYQNTGRADGSMEHPFPHLSDALAAMTGADGYVLFIAPGIYAEKDALETPAEGLTLVGNGSTLILSGGLTVKGRLIKESVTITGTVTIAEGGSIDEILHTGRVILDKATPVNAVAADVELAAALTTLIAAGDTLTFDGNTFSMVASDAGDDEFTDVDGLAAFLNALTAWGAVNAAGKVTITAAVKGLAGNGVVAVIGKTEDTTAGGGAAAKATATIAAASLAQMAAGDTVSFDGNTFAMVESGAGDGEFTNTAGLITLLDALEDWAAVADGSDIDITAAENGVEGNGKGVIITYKRTTAGGINGTVAVEGEACFDNSYLYVAKAANTVADANWIKVALT